MQCQVERNQNDAYSLPGESWKKSAAACRLGGGGGVGRDSGCGGAGSGTAGGALAGPIGADGGLLSFSRSRLMLANRPLDGFLSTEGLVTLFTLSLLAPVLTSFPCSLFSSGSLSLSEEESSRKIDLNKSLEAFLNCSSF